MSPREKAQMRADLFMARKQYDEAIKAYEIVLADDPRNAKVLNFIGMAYQQIGNGDLAEHYYKIAARADKTDSNALNNLGTVEYSMESLRQSDQVLPKGDRKGQRTGHGLYQSRLRLLRRQRISESNGGVCSGPGA